MKFDTRALDDLAKRLSEGLPPSVQALKTDLEQNFRAVLQSGLAKMELVTRAEFDVQTGVLARTRAKLEALEARLAVLEGALEEPAGPR